MSTVPRIDAYHDMQRGARVRRARHPFQRSAWRQRSGVGRAARIGSAAAVLGALVLWRCSELGINPVQGTFWGALAGVLLAIVVWSREQ